MELNKLQFYLSVPFTFKKLFSKICKELRKVGKISTSFLQFLLAI